MNSERLLKLADYLEKDTQPFSMLGWEECAAAQCRHIWPEDWIIPEKTSDEWNPPNYKLKEITIQTCEFACDEFRSTMEWFGLTETEAEQLFCEAERDQTREQTVRKIRHFVRDALCT